MYLDRRLRDVQKAIERLDLRASICDMLDELYLCSALLHIVTTSINHTHNITMDSKDRSVPDEHRVER
jgi:hypothetical protein